MLHTLEQTGGMVGVSFLLAFLVQTWVLAAGRDVKVAPDEYLVGYKGESFPEISSVQGFEVIRSYTVGGLRLAHVRLPGDGESLREILSHPLVEFAEENRIIELEPDEDGLAGGLYTPEPLRPNSANNDGSNANKTPKMSSDFEICDLHWYNPAINAWGIIRTSHRATPNYEGWGQPYITGQHDRGAGTRQYIVDTGIYLEHPDFEGRAVAGMVSDGVGEDKAVDLHGHGTHVAGTAGGARYGIARESTLVSCKVFNVSGSASDAQIIQALEWAINDVKERRAAGTPARGVINMSLGGPGASFAMETVIHAAIEEGIPVVVAAGNSDDDACLASPARVSDAITVAATDEWERLASFSNYGPCTDVMAPGVWIAGPHANGTFGEEFPYAVLSGTSMAAPHVSGVVARYLSSLPDAALTTTSPAHIKAMINDEASIGRIFHEGAERASTPNRLLYMGCGDGDIPRPPPTTTTTTPAVNQSSTEDSLPDVSEIVTLATDESLPVTEAISQGELLHAGNHDDEAATEAEWTAERVSSLAIAGLVLVCLTFGTNLGTGVAIWHLRRRLKSKQDGSPGSEKF